jgi:hypothetical protein
MSRPVIDLSEFDSEYRRQSNNPSPNRSGAVPIPDGRYRVRVENVELTTSKTSGQPMLKWTLRIAGPTHSNRCLWKNRVINQQTMRWVTDELSLCGLDLEPFSQLPRRLGELVDLELDITKKTTNGYEDVYFNQRVGQPSAAGDDDLPF